MKLSAPSVGGIGSRLKAKAGPLPVWAWSLAIVGAGLLAMLLRPKPVRGDDTAAETAAGPIAGQSVAVEPPAVVRGGISNTPASPAPDTGSGSPSSGGDMSTPPPDVHICDPLHPELEGCSGSSSGGGRPPMPRCPQGGTAHWNGSKWICSEPPGPTPAPSGGSHS